jgi:tetratricopeptide (TPR) repeat protein
LAISPCRAASDLVRNRLTVKRKDVLLQSLLDQASSRLTQKQLTTSCTSPEYVRLYSRLIEQEPQLAMLYDRRGSHYARIQDWEASAADYARAASLQPFSCYHYDSWGAVCLQMQNRQAYHAACRKYFEAHGEKGRIDHRMNMVVLCCLGPASSPGPQQLDRIAGGAPSQGRQGTFYRMVKAMAAYRCGRFWEALDILPDGGFVNPKDELLTLLFRAMSQQQVGHADQARRLLHVARKQILEKLHGPDGPPLPYQETPVVWCMVHTALREAEALIQPPAQRPGSGTDQVGREAPEAAVPNAPQC